MCVPCSQLNRLWSLAAQSYLPGGMFEATLPNSCWYRPGPRNRHRYRSFYPSPRSVSSVSGAMLARFATEGMRRWTLGVGAQLKPMSARARTAPQPWPDSDLSSGHERETRRNIMHCLSIRILSSSHGTADLEPLSNAHQSTSQDVIS